MATYISPAIEEHRVHTSPKIDPRPTFSRAPHSTPILATLPRLNTQVTPRSLLGAHRQSIVNKRLSAISGASVALSQSRPESHVFPAFHSSLEYALVRDFAYPIENLLHYGPPPDLPSGMTTPASEFSRRMSDPEISRNMRTVEEEEDDGSYFQLLPRRTFGDSPEDARYLDLGPAHKRGRSNVIDYDSGRGRIHETELNPILYPEAGMYKYQPSVDQDDEAANAYYAPRTPDLQATDSPSQSPSEAYDDEDFDALASPEDGYPGKAIALFDFHRENDNELPFVEGQVLWVSYKHGEGWLVAQDPKSGESGLVPEEYVRMLREIEGGLTGLKGEGYELDSPEGVEIDTPTEANGKHADHAFAAHLNASPAATTSSITGTKTTNTTSHETTPTA